MKSKKKKPLDTLVKLGLGVFLGGFLMIGIGMFISRPDRSIPPYSIGAQEGTVVAVHVPPWTSDPEIQTLIERFRLVGSQHKDFATMKIQPTTPEDPAGRYEEMTVYVFSDHEWAESEKLHRYLMAETNPTKEQKFKNLFESTVRGGFDFDKKQVKGWLGPVGGQRVGQANSEVQWLFQGTFSKNGENPAVTSD